MQDGLGRGNVLTNLYIKAHQLFYDEEYQLLYLFYEVLTSLVLISYIHFLM